MRKIVINPGTEPIAETSPVWAEANMKVFLEECGFPEAAYCLLPDDTLWGRYGFLVKWGQYQTIVHMPGIELEYVRFLGEGQNAWNYPRLYVDYSSWLWCFAVSIVRMILSGEGDNE